MKKNFDFCIYVSEIKHLLNLDQTLRIINKINPSKEELMDISLKVNLSSLAIVSDYLYKYYGINYIDDIVRIYYGQETCENLIPTLKNVQQAVEYCKEKEYELTIATPYVGPVKIDELRQIFEYLNSCESETGFEVVINDYGVLHMLNNEFPNLKPVLGRLLVKMKRDPRFSLSGYDIANTNLRNVRKVEENQEEVLQGASLELKTYQEFLRQKGFERVGIDTIPQGINPKALKKWDLTVDLYWPWTYITSSRNCAIAAYTQIGKDTHSTDEPCEFQCKLYEFTFSSDKKMMPSVQRGNAVWMSTESLFKEFFQAGFGRLIYQPYIPV